MLVCRETRALSDLFDLIASHHITLAQLTWLKLWTYSKLCPNQGWRVKTESRFYFPYKEKLEQAELQRRFFSFCRKEPRSREALGSVSHCDGSWACPHRAGVSQGLGAEQAGCIFWVQAVPPWRGDLGSVSTREAFLSVQQATPPNAWQHACLHRAFEKEGPSPAHRACSCLLPRPASFVFPVITVETLTWY